MKDVPCSHNKNQGYDVVIIKITSVQFNHSVMSDFLQPHGLQHARLSCPLPTPGVYSNSCPLSWWCHPTISSSVVPSPPAFNLQNNIRKVKRQGEGKSLHQSPRWAKSMLGYILFVERLVNFMELWKEVLFQQAWMGWESRRKGNVLWAQQGGGHSGETEHIALLWHERIHWKIFFERCWRVN